MWKCIFLNWFLLDNSHHVGRLVDLEVLQGGGLLLEPLQGGLLHQPDQDLPLHLLVKVLLPFSSTTRAKVR